MTNTAKFFTARQVRERFGVSRMWIERRLADSDFPRPVTFGTSRRYWKISEVEAWERQTATRNA